MGSSVKKKSLIIAQGLGRAENRLPARGSYPTVAAPPAVGLEGLGGGGGRNIPGKRPSEPWEQDRCWGKVSSPPRGIEVEGGDGAYRSTVPSRSGIWWISSRRKAPAPGAPLSAPRPPRLRKAARPGGEEEDEGGGDGDEGGRPRHLLRWGAPRRVKRPAGCLAREPLRRWDKEPAACPRTDTRGGWG